MKDLAGLTSVVTGGTRGIGAMIVAGLLEAGATVLTMSRKADACSAIVDQFSHLGKIAAAPFDLSQTAGIGAFANWIQSETGHVDILVNNAGATWAEPLDSFGETGWDRIMDLNLKSPFFVTQAMLPMLREAVAQRSRARVINIGSIDGLTVPDMDHYPYPISKAALHHMTRVFAKALAADGITVNAIAPGPFASKMTAFLLEDEASRRDIEARIPLGRIGRPADMAGLANFLASPGSDFITGAIIPLDGGYAALR